MRKNTMPLTYVETNILRLTANGKTTKEISRILEIHDYIVSNTLGTIRKKLGAASTSQAVAIACWTGIIKPENGG